MKRKLLKCGECGCFIKVITIKSTAEDKEDLGYPEEYCEFYCKKCKEYLNGFEVVEF